MLAIICISINVLTVISLVLIRVINIKRQAKIMKEFEMKQRRINQVSEMRKRVLFVFGTSAYDMLPPFDTMMQDGKELKAGSYLNADNVVESLN